MVFIFSWELAIVIVNRCRSWSMITFLIKKHAFAILAVANTHNTVKKIIMRQHNTLLNPENTWDLHPKKIWDSVHTSYTSFCIQSPFCTLPSTLKIILQNPEESCCQHIYTALRNIAFNTLYEYCIVACQKTALFFFWSCFFYFSIVVFLQIQGKRQLHRQCNMNNSEMQSCFCEKCELYNNFCICKGVRVCKSRADRLFSVSEAAFCTAAG